MSCDPGRSIYSTMESKVRYPIGMQSFAEIRKGGFAYVDKTEFVYKLVDSNKYYFLSRPRRFGKSLLLSTLKSYFEGDRQLFDGLAIEKLETRWHRHPVLLLSLARYNPDRAGSLDSLLESYLLESYLYEWEKIYGKRTATTDISQRFNNVIISAFEKTGSRVVILIDEYDAPIVGNLHDEKKQASMRDLLKSLYTNLKDCDDYIRFAMLTGVARFSKMSIFSGINNLKDISFNDRFAAICGITEDELRTKFSEGIANLADRLATDRNGALRVLKENYDGYHFTENCPDIYNPFSLLNALDDSKIKPYWFATGTPTFLVRMLQNRSGLLPEMFNEPVNEPMLSQNEADRLSPVSLMFQSGYLTIKSYDARTSRYTLGIPNLEVREGMFTDLASVYFNHDKNFISNKVWDIRLCFEKGDVDGAMRLLRAFLASIPYNLSGKRPEIYFENNLYIIFSLVGVETNTEWFTSDGRIDVVVRVPRYIYLLELKLDRPVTEVLTQIERKDYGRQFECDGRKIVRLGIEFSHETRNIVRWSVL